MKVSTNKKLKSNLNKSLIECQKTAKNAFRITNNYSVELENTIQDLSKKLNELSKEMILDKEVKGFSFPEQLNKVVNKFQYEVLNEITGVKRSLETKKINLKNFTLTFFGRTKAGKSTIRESISQLGDGSTIGLGKLHTTKEVKEYMWQGLRLLDTPGIEGFKGENEIERAHEVIDQSDILIFLTTDESTQPDEFREMSALIEINKPFFILLNVKDKLTGSDFLKRFLIKKGNLFDKKRIDEHHNRISRETKKLGIDNVEILSISAIAACISQFISRGFSSKNKNRFTASIKHPELKSITEWSLHNLSKEVANQLWELSQIEKVHDKIVREINKRGKHRRILTFYDSLINYVDSIAKFLNESEHILRKQAFYMIEKRKELEKIVDRFANDNKKKIKDKCSELFNDLVKWVPLFVDEYLGKDNAEKEYKKKLKVSSIEIEKQMSSLAQEIVEDLKFKLKEFHREFQYDIKMNYFNKSINVNYKEGQIGKILELSGAGVGVISVVAFAIASANFWNPVGWIAAGVSIVTSILGGIIKKKEEKKWKNVKREAIKDIISNIDLMKNNAINAYLSWFTENIEKPGKREMITKVSKYTDSLFKIVDTIKEYKLILKGIYNRLNRKMFIELFLLEGLTIKDDNIIAIARVIGYASKIVVSKNIQINENVIKSINKVCGENIIIIKDSQNIAEKISKAFYPVKPQIENIKILKKGDKSIAKISVSKSEIPSYVGKRHTNLKLVQEICGIKIELN